MHILAKGYAIAQRSFIKSTDLDPAEKLHFEHGNCLRDSPEGTTWRKLV